MAKKIIESEEDKKYRQTVDTIASNIMRLTQPVQAMINGPLKRRALVVLLASSSGETQRSVESVLKALEDLHKDWLNK